MIERIKAWFKELPWKLIGVAEAIALFLCFTARGRLMWYDWLAVMAFVFLVCAVMWHRAKRS